MLRIGRVQPLRRVLQHRFGRETTDHNPNVAMVRDLHVSLFAGSRDLQLE